MLVDNEHWNTPYSAISCYIVTKYQILISLPPIYRQKLIVAGETFSPAKVCMSFMRKRHNQNDTY